MYSCKRTLVILLALLANHTMAQSTTTFPGTVSDVKTINTQKLLKIMNQGNTSFLPVAAHRGYWQNVSENSIDSINLAYQSGIEAVEIDVRIASTQAQPFQSGSTYGELQDPSADLVLSHDECVDRQTSGSGALRNNPGSKCATKTGFTASEYTKQQLRNRAGNLYTSAAGAKSTPPLFAQALQCMKNYMSVDSQGILRGPVLVVDLKDKDNTTGELIAWNEYIYGLKVMRETLPDSMWPAVIWKLKMSSALPSVAEVNTEISKHPSYGHLVLTIVPEDVKNEQYGPLGSDYRELLGYSQSPTPYITQFEYVAFNARDGSDLYLKTLPSPGAPNLESFATYYQPSYYPEGVSNRFAGCCYLAPLNQAEIGTKTIDNIDTRGILDFATYYDSFEPGEITATITSDNLLETMNYLVVKGTRNVSQIQ